jgi:hypothetical protein
LAGSSSSSSALVGAGDARNVAASNISIFLRVRPVARPSPRLLLDAADGSVEFNIPKDAVAGCGALSLS